MPSVTFTSVLRARPLLQSEKDKGDREVCRKGGQGESFEVQLENGDTTGEKRDNHTRTTKRVTTDP